MDGWMDGWCHSPHTARSRPWHSTVHSGWTDHAQAHWHGMMMTVMMVMAARAYCQAPRHILWAYGSFGPSTSPTDASAALSLARSLTPPRCGRTSQSSAEHATCGADGVEGICSHRGQARAMPGGSCPAALAQTASAPLTQNSHTNLANTSHRTRCTCARA